MNYSTAILRDGDTIVKTALLPNGVTPTVVDVLRDGTEVHYTVAAVSEDRDYVLYERVEQA